ncbi:MAG: peptidylprolyl isomerase [Candidatus Omnitrophota bacterium]|jgi:peptidyl-prolyl cis-trans isomerase C|nr:peptidyl-prolyl cis-trans isomerase [Candidatus Omnitrophota bacterium]MDD5517822.1 peptidyl-prolyl cis-trans isomerase [Candidatus Omnitrophota bacterium]
MRYRIIFLGLGFFILSFLFGCDKLGLAKPKVKEVLTARLPAKGTVIAKVNNAPITLEDLDKEIDVYNSLVPEDKPENKVTTRDKKIDYLKNEMVRRTLLYQEALNRGLDRKEEIVQALEKTKQELLVMELIRKEAEKVEVSSKEIEDYYNTYKDQLKEPEERQLREIVLSSEQDAKDVLIQLLQGADFATLAKARSKSLSAKSGGDLGFIKRGQKSAQFDAVAFSDSLEAGKMSSIFKCPDGYYIIKLEAKRGGSQRSLADMWDDIRKGLTFLKQQKKIEDLIGKLSQNAKLEFYEGEIK